jgi:stearoyl-CoA desaturase (delta-9 desaturase)
MLKFKAIERTIMLWALLPIAVYGLYTLPNLWWLLGSAIVYQIIVMTLSVGNHRLFAHRVFKCNRLWHWVFAVIGVASGNGSSVQWVLIHLGHHLYADTPKDPHPNSFNYFIRTRHKSIDYSLPQVNFMMRDKIHRITHEYALLFVLIFPILAYLVSFNVFVYLYAIPVAFQLISGGLFFLYSHNKTGALNQYWLEFLLPMSGEWNHKHHHINPKNPNFQEGWFDIDLGYQLIRIIQNG